MSTFLQTLREKPEHIRHRIALATAASITLIIIIGWGAAVATSGKLAFNPDTSFGASETTTAPKVAETNTFGGLLGAAVTAFSSSSTTAPTALSVVDQSSSSTLERETAREDRTVIPF